MKQVQTKMEGNAKFCLFGCERVVVVAWSINQLTGCLLSCWLRCEGMGGKLLYTLEGEEVLLCAAEFGFRSLSSDREGGTVVVVWW